MLGRLGSLIRRRPRTAVACLVVLLLAGAGTGFYAHALHQWRQAPEAVKAGRYGEGRDCLRLCLTVWPRSLPVHLLAARAARLAGDFGQAEEHLQQCMKLAQGATDDVRLEFYLMRVQRGEVDEVAPALLRCVENKHPETVTILQTVAPAYMRSLRYGPDMGVLERWIKEYPDSAQARQWRGWVMERQNQASEAMKEYLEALELDPDLVAVRLRVVDMLLEDNRPLDALPHLERLRKLAPDRADVIGR